MAAESVEKAKDIAESVEDFVEDKTEALSQNETVKKVMDATEDVGKKIIDSTSGAVDKAQDLAESVGKKVLSSTEGIREKAADMTEDLGEKVIDTASSIKDKAQDITESVGSKVLETVHGSDETSSGLEDANLDAGVTEPSASEKLGDKIIETASNVKETLAEKALEATEKLEGKLKDLTEKALEFEKEEAAKPKKDFADETLDTGGSLLEGTGDFFSKAEEFAKGNYSGDETPTTPKDDADIVSPVELPQDPDEDA